MICILSYVDDNDDDYDYVKYTLQLSWFTLPETRPEPDPEPGLLTITRPEVKKCYLSCPALNTEFWPLSFIGRGWLEEGNLYQQQSPNLSPKSWQCKSLFVIHVFLDMFLDAAFRGGHLNLLLWTFVQKYTELRKPSFTILRITSWAVNCETGFSWFWWRCQFFPSILTAADHQLSNNN